MSEENLDDWIKKTREDFKQKELWDILSPQLDRLVDRGSPDLQAFYEDLRKKQLVAEEEINEMKMCYPLDSVSNQLDCHNTNLSWQLGRIAPGKNGGCCHAPEEARQFEGLGEGYARYNRQYRSGWKQGADLRHIRSASSD
jgi:hypothetical protein